MQEQYPIYEKFPSRTEIIGGLVALAPFALTFNTSSSRTVNGVVVESAYMDYAALALGPVAILIGLFALRLLSRTAEEDRIKRIVTIVAIIGVGALHILRGLGIVIL